MLHKLEFAALLGSQTLPNKATNWHNTNFGIHNEMSSVNHNMNILHDSVRVASPQSSFIKCLWYHWIAFYMFGRGL